MEIEKEPSISPSTPLEQGQGTEDLDKAIREKDLGNLRPQEKITKKKKIKQETLKDTFERTEKQKKEVFEEKTKKIMKEREKRRAKALWEKQGFSKKEIEEKIREMEEEKGSKVPKKIETEIEELKFRYKEGKISPEEIKMMGKEKSELTEKDIYRIDKERIKQKEEKEKIEAIKREEMENKAKEVKNALKEATMELAVADMNNYFAKEKERKGVSWFSRKRAAKKEIIQTESINAENEYNEEQKRVHNLLRQKIALEGPELEKVGDLYGNFMKGTEDVVDRIFAEDLKKGEMTTDEKWVKINEVLGKIYNNEELPQWYIEETRESHITLEGMKERCPELREEIIREKLKSYDNKWDNEMKRVNERISEIQGAIIKGEKIGKALKKNQEQNKEKIENLPQEKKKLMERLTFKRWREKHPKAVIAIEIGIGTAMIGGSFVCPIAGPLAGFMYGKLGLMSVPAAEFGWQIVGIGGGGAAAAAVSSVRDLIRKRKEGKIIGVGEGKTETETETETGATGEYASGSEIEKLSSEDELDELKETRKKTKKYLLNYLNAMGRDPKTKMNIFKRQEPGNWEFYQKLVRERVSKKEMEEITIKNYLKKL